MERRAWAFVGGVTAFVLALGACSKQADTPASAPGGSADTPQVVRPAAPDGPPGGPSGIAGSGPHSGASGGDVIPGTTGGGTSDATGRSQTAQPGSGLGGGLGGNNSAAMGAPATPGGGGSSNATSSSAVGQRP